MLIRNVMPGDQEIVTCLYQQDLFHPTEFLLDENTKSGAVLPINCLIGELTSFRANEASSATLEVLDEEELVALQARASMECKYLAIE